MDFASVHDIMFLAYYPIRSLEISLQYSKMPNIVKQAIFAYDMDLTDSENGFSIAKFFFLLSYEIKFSTN